MFLGKGVYKKILSIYAPINLKKQEITVAGERIYEVFFVTWCIEQDGENSLTIQLSVLLKKVA